ncbi:hypothetical protein MVG78_20775 (plasmid) [Roseomonas gilardii subsp. gilardii]|uniref:hypothetical protein n=1 Tax=Roseomonas gilardii TaxID=257708 RepID=UPI001FFA16F2|nr:hypothetical protein [Roseomonas gilardii]UPG74533.1 hypothetical protein MVG78_20775 [Roseomonas gilardii subsp. gilardii]
MLRRQFLGGTSAAVLGSFHMVAMISFQPGARQLLWDVNVQALRPSRLTGWCHCPG